MSRWLIGTAVVALALLVAGCDIDGDPNGSDQGTGTGLIPFEAPPAVFSPPNDASLCAGGDFEGCFDIEGMQNYADAVLPLIKQFNDETYTAMPWPTQVMFIPVGYVGDTGCVSATGAADAYTDQTYAYCPKDSTIYLGQSQLFAFYVLGDAAPAVGMAHEFGHHFQSQAGLVDHIDTLVQQGQSLQTLLIAQENQADCIAGAWAKWAREKGYFTDDDLVDTASLIPVIASSELDPNRDHGTLQERSQSFDRGFLDGMYSCNDYFPGKPVIT